MTSFFIWVLIGMGCGVIILPIFMLFFTKIRDAAERRRIKRMIKNGQLLITIDKRDFDTEAWKEVINLDNYKGEVENLNNKIFNHEK